MAKIEISKVNKHIEVHSRIGDNVSLLATYEGAYALGKAKEFAKEYNEKELGGVAEVVIKEENEK